MNIKLIIAFLRMGDSGMSLVRKNVSARELDNLRVVLATTMPGKYRTRTSRPDKSRWYYTLVISRI